MGSDLWSRIILLLCPWRVWGMTNVPDSRDQCTADLASPWITRSSVGRPVSASIAPVGVSISLPLSPGMQVFVLCLVFPRHQLSWQSGHHTKDAKVTDVWMIETYGQWTTLGLRPHVAPQAHSRLWAFLTLTSTCFLQVSWESVITPRYLTNLERFKVTLKKCSLKKPGGFLLLVNTMSSVLSGFTNSLTIHLVSTVRRVALIHRTMVWLAQCLTRASHMEP